MKCDYCEGTGVGLFKPKCPFCDGAGVQYETSFEEYITCVHCGEKNEETTDYPDSLRYEGDETEIECHKCGERQTVVVSVAYTYQTKVPKPETSESSDA